MYFWAVPWLGRLVVGLSLWAQGFDSKQVEVKTFRRRNSTGTSFSPSTLDVLCQRLWTSFAHYLVVYLFIWYDMIYLLTAIGLSPGGSSTVHIYTQTIHRMTQNKRYIERVAYRMGGLGGSNPPPPEIPKISMESSISWARRTGVSISFCSSLCSHSFIIQYSVWRQVQSLLQNDSSTQCDAEPPPSNENIPSCP